MAEPLSVITGVVQLCGATLHTIEFVHENLKHYKDAEKDIESMNCDITSLGDCLHHYKRAVNVCPDGSLNGPIRRGGDILSSLKDLLAKSILKHSDNSISIRLAWLRNRKAALKMSEEIRNTCSILDCLVSAQTPVNFATTREDLERMSRIHEKGIASVLAACHQLHTQVSDLALQSDPSTLAFSNPNHLQTNSKPLALPTHSSALQSPISSARLTPTLPDRSRDTRLLKPYGALYRKHGFGLCSTIALKRDSQCRCRCHTLHPSEPLTSVDTLLGSLRFRATNMFWQKSCDILSCKCRAEPFLKLSYHSPKQLPWRWKFSGAYSKVFLKGTFLSAKMNRLVPMDALVFKAVHDDDVAALQYLFDNGEATPNDIQGVGKEVLFGGSYSPILTIAVYLGHVKVTEFLINAGADVELEDDDGR